MTRRRKLVARAALVAVLLGAATIVIVALRRPLRDRWPLQAGARVEYVVVGSGEGKRAYVYWIHDDPVLPKVALGFFVGGLVVLGVAAVLPAGKHETSSAVESDRA